MFKLDIVPTKIFHTKYGKTKLNRDGYSEISTRKEGNNGKMWHRLIWEEFYGPLPKDTHIHHIDGNPSNNCIWNLEPMPASEHLKMHNGGNIRRRQNNTGYYRVSKCLNGHCNQGFIYSYQYFEDGKRKAIRRINLNDLEDAVKEKGLLWSKLEDMG